MEINTAGTLRRAGSLTGWPVSGLIRGESQMGRARSLPARLWLAVGRLGACKSLSCSGRRRSLIACRNLLRGASGRRGASVQKHSHTKTRLQRLKCEPFRMGPIYTIYEPPRYPTICQVLIIPFLTSLSSDLKACPNPHPSICQKLWQHTGLCKA